MPSGGLSAPALAHSASSASRRRRSPGRRDRSIALKIVPGRVDQRRESPRLALGLGRLGCVSVVRHITSSQAILRHPTRKAPGLNRSGKIVESELLDPAPRKPAADRLVVLVAGIASAARDCTLQQIASQLEGMRERTLRGGTRWHASPVRHLLRRAERLGLLGAPSPALPSDGHA